MKRICVLFCLSILNILMPANAEDSQLSSGLRTIVTTDPELDDNNSLIRFLLYSNELNIEGLITSSSEVHWKGDGKGTIYQGKTEADRFNLKLCPCTEWRWYDQHIQDVVKAYGKVYTNLKVHDSRYPNPEFLNSLIREGNVAFPGDISEPSPGSELIKDALLDDKPGPIFLQAWGGPSTIARALLSIEEQYSSSKEWLSIKQKVSKKAIITAFGAQDDSYFNYIAPNWPDIQFWQLASYVWGYNTRNVILEKDRVYLDTEWHSDNIINQGPLGELYRVWGDGKRMVQNDPFDFFDNTNYTATELKKLGRAVWTKIQKKGAFISEGDTTAFLNLLNTGLRSHENPTWGGWGGRAVKSNTMGFTFGKPIPSSILTSLWAGTEARDFDEYNGARADYAVGRWFSAAQNDFAARLRWSVESDYKNANHQPISYVTYQDIQAKPGETINLRATVSDPDGDEYRVRWWQYVEAGSYPEKIKISNAAKLNAELKLPFDGATGDTIHIILEVTDEGKPALKSYQRVVITFT